MDFLKTALEDNIDTIEIVDNVTGKVIKTTVMIGAMSILSSISGIEDVINILDYVPSCLSDYPAITSEIKCIHPIYSSKLHLKVKWNDWSQTQTSMETLFYTTNITDAVPRVYHCLTLKNESLLPDCICNVSSFHINLVTYVNNILNYINGKDIYSSPWGSDQLMYQPILEWQWEYYLNIL